MWVDMDGNKVIDRVYGREEFMQMFRDYAREIGAYKKECDSAGESLFISPDGSRCHKAFNISIQGEFERFPYVDTFCYYDSSENVLSNEQTEHHDKKLQDTGGGFENLEGVRVYGREGTFDEEVCRWSNYHDEFLYEDDAIYVDNDYYYAPDGATCEALYLGRRNYVLLNDCSEVEVFNADDFSGLTCYDDIETFTCYSTPDGQLIGVDEATIVDVFAIDGEIMGEVE
jgi:hypothetical protein